MSAEQLRRCNQIVSDAIAQVRSPQQAPVQPPPAPVQPSSSLDEKHVEQAPQSDPPPLEEAIAQQLENTHLADQTSSEISMPDQTSDEQSGAPEDDEDEDDDVEDVIRADDEDIVRADDDDGIHIDSFR
jgi:hypothetical protein